MVRRIKIKNAASIYEAMPAFQILPPSSKRGKPAQRKGLAFLFASALQRLDLSKTHGAYLFYAPLRNLEPINLNPEPVAPATRLERKEAHLFFFRQSFEDAHGV